MPQQLICPEHGKVTLDEYELPATPKPGSLHVRNTHGAEKHGTMTSFYRGYANQRGAYDAERQIHTGEGEAWGYPIPLGNMQVGTVEAVGEGVEGFEAGDRVVHFGNFRPSAATSPKVTWKIGPDTNWKAAVCLDPATFAMCALRDGNARVGDAVAIFSLGAIGLMAVQLAKLSGCFPVIAIDPLENRRAAAKATGADIVLDPTTGEDIGLKIRELTDWRGADVVVEYSGAMEAMQASVKGVAFGGNIVAGAFPPPYKAGLDFGGEAHMNRPNLVFSRTESDPNRDHPRWDNTRIRNACMHLINAGRIDAEPIIDPIVPFDDGLVDAYLKIAEEPHHNIKFGVTYDA
jgi:threonine dehydrogenase-like Zn-dependent dehydrogenase